MNKSSFNQAWHQVHVARETRSSLDVERAQADERLRAARARLSRSTFPATQVHHEDAVETDDGANDERDSGR